ncbi:MAG: hypothetical protein ACRC6X_03265 [Culicoidibacterales bacterium]
MNETIITMLAAEDNHSLEAVVVDSSELKNMIKLTSVASGYDELFPDYQTKITAIVMKNDALTVKRNQVLEFVIDKNYETNGITEITYETNQGKKG